MPEQRLILEEACPASQSLGWRIHQAAFAQEGAQAWLDFRIPYSVTGNIALARQKAQVIRGSLPVSDQPVYVLELGAGLGFFAWHFIQAWQEFDALEGVRPLHYLLTDFSRSTLAAVVDNPWFAPLIEAGHLGVFWLDQPAAAYLEPISNIRFATPQKLQAVIGNYYACTLPTTLLRMEKGLLHEKWVKTWLELPAVLSVLNSDQKNALRDWILSLLVSQPLSDGARAQFLSLCGLAPTEKQEALVWAEALPFELLSQIEESVFYESLAPERWSERDQALLQIAGEDLNEQTFPWTDGLWERLFLLQDWLDPGALLLLSDKGYYVSSGVLPADLAEPSFHGNTWAYPLHLDLLSDWLCFQGWKTAHTPYPFDPLQTLVAAWQPAFAEDAYAWQTAFQTHFVENNANLDAARLVRAAQDYQTQEDDQMAVGFYQKALRYRPGEPRILHELASCLIRLGAFQLAEEILAQPCVDLYGQFDFDYQRGQIAFFQSRAAEAIAAFQRSLQQQGEYASVYYSLALSYLAQAAETEAAEALQRCLVLEPEHRSATQLLQRLQSLSEPLS
ncbi:MAG: hypothetical protein AB7I41_20085 [Candidatus Sericytochromatia bacterium]